MPHHVFLTYSVKDLYHVHQLRDSLSLYGVRCWPGRILTPGTDQWLIGVQSAVAEAACVVAVLSPDTLMSRWVLMALDYARVYHVPVIPAIVRGEPGHILMVTLAGLDWFDLRYRSRYAAEIRALVGLVQEHVSARVAAMA